MKIGIDLGGSHIAVGVVDNNNELIEKVEKDFSEEDKMDIRNCSTRSCKRRSYN